MKDLCRKIKVSLFFISLMCFFSSTVIAEPSLRIEDYALSSKKRITRTVFEYTYTVKVKSTNSDAQNVVGLVNSTSEHTVVVDGEVNFGTVAEGSIVTGSDTITIRQDRKYPFDSEAFTWSFDYQGLPTLPSDPGEDGKATLLGIDSDNDGVRDDIQRYIYFTYPDEKNVRLALTQISINYQELLPVANDPEAVHVVVEKIYRSIECLFYVKNDFATADQIEEALTAEILNTEERSRVFIEANNSLAGKTTRLTPMEEQKNCCLFNVD